MKNVTVRNGNKYYPASTHFEPEIRNGNLYYNAINNTKLRNKKAINLEALIKKLSPANQRELQIAKVDPDAYKELLKNIRARLRVVIPKPY
jgi:hypothetical protein